MQEMSGYNLEVSRAVEELYGKNSAMTCLGCGRRRPVLPTEFRKMDCLKSELTITSWAYNDPGWIRIEVSMPPYGCKSGWFCPDCCMRAKSLAEKVLE